MWKLISIKKCTLNLEIQNYSWLCMTTCDSILVKFSYLNADLGRHLLRIVFQYMWRFVHNVWHCRSLVTSNSCVACPGWNEGNDHHHWDDRNFVIKCEEGLCDDQLKRVPRFLLDWPSQRTENGSTYDSSESQGCYVNSPKQKFLKV